MKDWKNILLGVLCVVAAFLLFCIIYQRNQKTPPVDVLRITDTVVVHNTDTIFKEKIKYVTKYDTIVTRDVVINDSIHQIIDTLEIPIEHKEAQFSISKDSLTINTNVYYQGFRAQIDSIETSYNLHYVIPQKKPRKFHIALSAGYYTGYNLIDRKLYSGPGAGISFTYDLW